MINVFFLSLSLPPSTFDGTNQNRNWSELQGHCKNLWMEERELVPHIWIGPAHHVYYTCFVLIFLSVLHSEKYEIALIPFPWRVYFRMKMIWSRGQASPRGNFVVYFPLVDRKAGTFALFIRSKVLFIERDEWQGRDDERFAKFLVPAKQTSYKTSVDWRSSG